MKSSLSSFILEYPAQKMEPEAYIKSTVFEFLPVTDTSWKTDVSW